jgi:hypothetical protein
LIAGIVGSELLILIIYELDTSEWVGAGLFNLFAPFKAIGEPAPTAY